MMRLMMFIDYCFCFVRVSFIGLGPRTGHSENRGATTRCILWSRRWTAGPASNEPSMARPQSLPACDEEHFSFDIIPFGRTWRVRPKTYMIEISERSRVTIPDRWRIDISSHTGDYGKIERTRQAIRHGRSPSNENGANEQ